MAETLYNLGYTLTKANPDVWIQPTVKPDHGFKYYEMLLVYVDDVLSVSHDTEVTMKGIQGTFKLKGDKIEVPTHYLGTQDNKKVMDGHNCWTNNEHKACCAPWYCQ